MSVLCFLQCPLRARAGASSHLDPDVAVRSQGRVVEAGRRALAHGPPKGRGRPHEHVPAEAEQRHERAQAAAAVHERPVARGAELHREPHRQQQHAAEQPRHLHIPRRSRPLSPSAVRFVSDTSLHGDKPHSSPVSKA